MRKELWESRVRDEIKLAVRLGYVDVPCGELETIDQYYDRSQEDVLDFLIEARANDTTGAVAKAIETFKYSDE